MNKEELLKRQNNLLDGMKLSAYIAQMIRTKNLPAVQHSITTIAGRDGRSELVIELFIDILNTSKIARTYLYITEDIYNEDDFEWVDGAIGQRIKNVNIDDKILLRVLRVVFTVIKNISTGYANAVDTNKTIYVRTNQIGLCNYTN